MTGQSRVLKLAALLLAGGAHGALAVALVPEAAQIQMEQGAGGADVRLGAGFADFAKGVEVEETPDALAEAMPEPLARELPDAMHAVDPISTVLMAAQPVPLHSAVAPAKAAMVMPVQAVMLPDPAALALTASVQDKLDSQSADSPSDVLGDTSADRLTATEPQDRAVTRSLRPRSRSATVAAQHKPAKTKSKPKRETPVQKTARVKTPAKPKPKAGRADRDATAGTTQGRATGRHSSQGSGGKKRQSGNAASANYQGKLASCIQRKVRVSARGKVRPVFAITISGAGRVTAASLVRSSGNARLDREALSGVRRVRGCPKPPAGARRSFTLGIR
jgi:protein TonB